MAALGELEKAIKDSMSLKCRHCGELNPPDVVKCIYCNHIIRRRANPRCGQEETEGGQDGQGTGR